jgi:general secretion pathway protein K
MAAEALAAIVLEQDGAKNKTALNEDWAQPLPPTEIEGTGVWVAGQIEDMTSRFNLNSLVSWNAQSNQLEPNQRQVEVFQNLLATLNIDQRYADLLADWLDTGINPQPNGGGEDTLYLSQTPPYRPPNTLITHPSELLALPAFGAENYAKLAPYVTALPWYTGLNPCTAALLLIDMVNHDGQSQWQSAPMGTNRQKGCWPDKQMVNASFADPAKASDAMPYYAEKSDWFRLRTNIRIGTSEFVLYSVLYREKNNRVRTVQRSFGSE